jgi:hypothetical protein
MGAGASQACRSAEGTFMKHLSLRGVALPAAAVVAVLAALGATGLPAGAAVTPSYGTTILAGGPNVAVQNAHSQTPEEFSTAAVGALQGSGSQDVVAGFHDGSVHAWNLATGRQFLDVNVGDGTIEASPAIVTIGSQTYILGATMNGLVFLMNPNGTYRFRYRVPVAHGGLTGVFGTPSVAYLDDTTKPWLVFSSYNQELMAVDLAGNEHAGFPYFFQDTSWSSPAVARFPGQKYPVIVVGYDCGGGPAQTCYTKYHTHGGFVTALDHDARPLPGWPYLLNGQVVWSSPAVGDLLGNGGVEVAVGTGLFWNAPAGDEVVLLSATGHPLPGWPVKVPGRVMSSPAIARIGGQGYLAVSVENGMLDLFTTTGSLRWSRCPFVQRGYQGCPGSHAGVAIADVTDSGTPEIIGAANDEWRVFDLAGSSVAAGYVGGSQGLSETATVTSVNGHAVLLYASDEDGGGSYGSSEVAEYTFDNKLGAAPWPTFKQNSARTGMLPPG